MWRAVDNCNYMCHICAKGFLDETLNEAFTDKISISHEITPNTHKNRSIIGQCWKEIDQPLLPL